MQNSLISEKTLKTSHDTQLEELAQSIERFNSEIKADQHTLSTINPLALMQLRAEHAEAALKASDIALKALEVLQTNSY